jgi:hypothetical protein
MNYIFYRMYRWYNEKEKVEARYSAIMFISAIHMTYIALFTYIFSSLFSNSGAVFPCLFAGCDIANIILQFRRYNKNKIVFLLKKYRNDWRNKVIGNWMIFMTLPLSFPCAILLFKILFARQILIFGYEFSGLLRWLIEIFNP